MRKINSSAVAILLAFTSTLALQTTAQATEPSLPVLVNVIPTALANRGYDCGGPSTDTTSKGTERWYSCASSTATAYVHGNSTNGALSYVKFVALTSSAYSDFEWMADLPVAGKSTSSASKWVITTYKKVKKGQKISKVFEGVSYLLSGGVGQIRTLEIGKKPS